MADRYRIIETETRNGEFRYRIQDRPKGTQEPWADTYAGWELLEYPSLRKAKAAIVAMVGAQTKRERVAWEMSDD